MIVVIFLGVGISYAYFTARASAGDEIKFANISADFVTATDQVYTTELLTSQLGKIKPGDNMNLQTLYLKNTSDVDVYALIEVELQVFKYNEKTASYTSSSWYNLAGTIITGDATTTTVEATLLKTNEKAQAALKFSIPGELGNEYKRGTATISAKAHVIQSLLKPETGVSTAVTASRLIYQNKDQQDYVFLSVDGVEKSVILPTSKKVADVTVDGVTTDNTPGWFYDADCTQYAYDTDTLAPSTKLYTKTATLDKLNITTNTDGTATISKSTDIAIGDVVIPRTYTTGGTTYTVTTIDQYAFSLNTSSTGNTLNTSLTSIILPNTILSFGTCAFSGCSKIKEFNFPKTFKSIGSYCFRFCTFENIDLPENIDIGGGAFIFCIIKEIVIPKNAQMYFDTFWACKSLEKVTIEEGVTSIPSNCFRANTSLKTVIMSQTIQSITDYAFIECESLQNIVLPQSLIYIAKEVFKGCTSLTSIIIPSSVKTIGTNVFSGCTNLSIYCEASSKPSGWADTWNPSDCPVTWGYTSTTSAANLTLDMVAILPSKQKWDE